MLESELRFQLSQVTLWLPLMAATAAVLRTK